MSIFVQHGYGKSDKVERALASGSVDGVIIGPRDESPANLADFCARLRANAPECTVAIDPQFYVSTIPDARSGHLPEYPYFEQGLEFRDFRSPTNISNYVRNSIHYQVGLAVTHILSPAVCVDGLEDRWSLISMQMANESIDYFASLNDDRPLLVSVIVHEQALRSAQAVSDFLDLLTELECAGFYIVVRRESAELQQTIDSDALASLQYISFVLSELNNYTTWFGYTDLISLPLHAAGATATACGWQFGLRRFTYRRFEPAAGGRQPRPRYTSIPLLNCLYINPELDAIQRAGRLADVLTGTSVDGRLNVARPSLAAWPNDISALHHWEALASGLTPILAAPDANRRLPILETLIHRADMLYGALRRNVPFEPASGPGHLADWTRAIADFRQRAGL